MWANIVYNRIVPGRVRKDILDMKIYLVRHGETEWNKEYRLQGQADTRLNDYGRELAEITAEALKEIPFDVIYHSPLSRAEETAVILKRDRKIDIIADERLKEMSFGIAEGCHIQEIKNNPKVASFEGTDIRDFIIDEGKYDIAVTDVSFISIKIIAPHIFRLLKNGGRAVILIKPQFEVGKKFLNKKGVVKDIKTAVRAADDVTEFIKGIGFEILGKCESPVKGGDGNTEFICLCRRTN